MQQLRIVRCCSTLTGSRLCCFGPSPGAPAFGPTPATHVISPSGGLLDTAWSYSEALEGHGASETVRERLYPENGVHHTAP